MLNLNLIAAIAVDVMQGLFLLIFVCLKRVQVSKFKVAD